MRKLLLHFLFIATLFLMACSSNNSPEASPFDSPPTSAINAQTRRSQAVLREDAPIFYVWRYNDELRFVLLGKENGQVVQNWDLETLNVNGKPVAEQADVIRKKYQALFDKEASAPADFVWDTQNIENMSVEIPLIMPGKSIDIYTSEKILGSAEIDTIHCFAVENDSSRPYGLPQEFGDMTIGIYGTLRSADEKLLDEMIGKACLGGRSGLERSFRDYTLTEAQNENDYKLELNGQFLDSEGNDKLHITYGMRETEKFSYGLGKATWNHNDTEAGKMDMTTFDFVSFGEVYLVDLTGSGRQDIVWLHCNGVRLYSLDEQEGISMSGGCIQNIAYSGINLLRMSASNDDSSPKKDSIQGVYELFFGPSWYLNRRGSNQIRNGYYYLLGGLQDGKAYGIDRYVAINGIPIEEQGNSPLTDAYQSALPMIAAPSMYLENPYVKEGDTISVFTPEKHLGEATLDALDVMFSGASAEFDYFGLLQADFIDKSLPNGPYFGVSPKVNALPRSVKYQRNANSYQIKADIDGDGQEEEILWDTSTAIEPGEDVEACVFGEDSQGTVHPVVVRRNGKEISRLSYFYDNDMTYGDGYYLLDLDGNGVFELIMQGSGHNSYTDVYCFENDSFVATPIGWYSGD